MFAEQSSTGRERNASFSPLPLESLLDRLAIKLEAFALCEIENGHALRCGPLDTVVVHFVLSGKGEVHWQGGILPIKPGAIILVPKGLSKQINASGPIRAVVDADHACPLEDGLVAFRSGEGEADLLIGCGAVDVSLGDGPCLLEGLDGPLCAEADVDVAPLLFRAILAELGELRDGSRGIITALMQQVMILALRDLVHGSRDCSQLHLALVHPRLSRVITAIISQPELPHTLESLAKTAGMSRSHFSKRFTAVFGWSPIQYLHATRMRRAARIIETSHMPIKAIAAAVGYASRSQFSRAFRSNFGVDPRQFRRGKA